MCDDKERSFDFNSGLSRPTSTCGSVKGQSLKSYTFDKDLHHTFILRIHNR